ncbi:MAG: aldehyde dehydrogenase family protein, partial [Clostridiaceae bacterium]|nr:aldehyde dehydrogenase family protein [Clostridiaceae bacterium]
MDKNEEKDLAIRDKFEICRRFFDSDKSRSYEARRHQLLLLQGRIKELTPEIEQALKEDLNNSSFEAYMTEIGLVLDEIRYALKHLKRWMKPRSAKVALTQMPGRVKRYPEPYGVVLIMSPWNYPFQLSLNPLVGAIAAGNTAVLKPSAYSPATTEILGKVLSVLDPGWVELVTGGREENRNLLKLDFDYIFFTGSPAVGRDVMRQAAANLTPVTLELGGKSPAIVAADADLKLAARRIAFGKLVNAGQTCIAPDYVICEEGVKQAFLGLLQEEFSQLSRDEEYFRKIYPKIINKKHFDRLQAYLAETPPAFGGRIFPETRQIEPAIIDSPAEDSEVMQEEIFGPILPVISLPDLGTAISYVRQ